MHRRLVFQLPSGISHYTSLYIIWPKICIPVANALEIPLSQCSNAGHFDMISASLRSFDTRDWHDCHLCKLALCDLECAVPHIWNWHTGPLATWNLHELMPGNWAENNEVYCDIHKLLKLWNFIHDVFLKSTFRHLIETQLFKLVVSYFGTPGLHYHIRTCDVL